MTTLAPSCSQETNRPPNATKKEAGARQRRKTFRKVFVQAKIFFRNTNVIGGQAFLLAIIYPIRIKKVDYPKFRSWKCKNDNFR